MNYLKTLIKIPHAFTLASEFTVAKEAGYVNHPDDPGGETKYGISKRSYPDTDIKNLTRDDALRIYFLDFWLKPKLDLLPPCTAILCFDFGIHSGCFKAIKVLQRTINETGFAWLKTDGKLGRITAGVITLLLQRERAQLHNSYVINRAVFMASLKNHTMTYGWMRRLKELHEYAQTISN